MPNVSAADNTAAESKRHPRNTRIKLPNEMLTSENLGTPIVVDHPEEAKPERQLHERVDDWFEQYATGLSVHKSDRGEGATGTIIIEFAGQAPDAEVKQAIRAQHYSGSRVWFVRDRYIEKEFGETLLPTDEQTEDEPAAE
jgi:hypothetical protein